MDILLNECGVLCIVCTRSSTSFRTTAALLAARCQNMKLVNVRVLEIYRFGFVRFFEGSPRSEKKIFAPKKRCGYVIEVPVGL